jgi:nucleotide-binding universal stress UspA family protein
MMTNVADLTRTERAAPGGRPKPHAGEARTLRILAAVDGSECTGRVMKYLLAMRALHARFDVVLLNVQPQPEDRRLRGYGWFKREEILGGLNERSRRIVGSVARQLDAAGITHKDRFELGDAADAIVRCAGEEDCDLIVLAEAPPSPLGRWLARSAGLSIGSLASVVAAFASVPVVVAK